jgi:autotransporter-associated beta strand protein
VISFDGTTAYTQDFQTMTGTAILSGATLTQSLTSSTMTEVSTLVTGSSGVQGWFIYGLGWTGASTSKWYGADPGSSSSGGFRQVYDTSGGRALGALGSGSANGFFGLVLQNTSSSTIDTLQLSYDAVMNRNPSSTINQYPLSYLVSATDVSTSTALGAAGTFGATMTATTLGFSTPATGTGAPGTQAVISPMFKIGTKAGNLTGLGWGAGQFLYLAWKELEETGSDTLAGVDNFSLSAPVVRNLVWNLAGSGVWDAATANWANNLTPTTYAAGDGVTFNGTGGTITLSGALAPISVNVSNASGTYVFSGATASDKITGATALTKASAGILQLTSDNDYSGGTTISGGTIVVDGASRLGTGTIALAGGTLQLAAGTYTVANALSVAAAGGTVDAVADRTISGAAALSGVLTKLGTGTLTLGGNITSSVGAGFNVAAGDLVLGQASGIVKVFANSTLTGNLVLSGPIRFDVDGSSTISGPGAIKVVSSGALISNTSGDLGGTVTSEIILNSTGAAFTKGAWTGTTYTPSTTFATTIGGTSGGALSVNKISGNSDVDISNNSSTGGGTGPLTLTGVSTYTGNTTINANTPTLGTSLLIGVDNALPTTTGIIVGTKTGTGRLPVIDLNGYSQQVAYLADGALVSVSQYLTITNNAATASVLTLGGDTSPGTGFSGYLSDGAGGLSLVKTGSNTQTLSGFNAFNGGVTVNGGVLRVVAATGGTSSSALGTGGVVIGGTGQLFVATTITNDLTVNAGGRLAGNGATGAVTVNSTGVLAAATTPGLLNAATLTTNGLTTLKSGSVLEWKVNDAAGLAGIGYDTFAFGLGLDLSNLSAANKATIRVVSFANAGDAVFGNSTAFANGQARTFTLANVGSITMPGSTNNITDLFAYDLTQFRFADGTQSDLANWSLAYDGAAISLAYASAIPEPSTYGLGLGCLALAFVAVRRRRQSAPKA